MKTKIFDNGFVQIIRETLFDSETTEDYILYFLTNKHKHFVEFMLKIFRTHYAKVQDSEILDKYL